MESARKLPAPAAGASPSSAPILPPAPAREAPRLERRDVELTLVRPHAVHRRTSVKAYLFGALALAAVSVAGWFVLGEYIYG